MTRKKFIKIAMSKGMDKRMATFLAEMVRYGSKSYEFGYKITLKHLKTMEIKKLDK